MNAMRTHRKRYGGFMPDSVSHRIIYEAGLVSLGLVSSCVPLSPVVSGVSLPLLSPPHPPIYPPPIPVSPEGPPSAVADAVAHPGSSIPKSPDRAPVLQRPAKTTEPRIRVVYSERFEDFWRHYPLPVGKGAAYRAWLKAAGTVGGEMELLEAIKEPLLEAKASAKWLEDGGKFIPHPATWLNQRRWEDGL